VNASAVKANPAENDFFFMNFSLRRNTSNEHSFDKNYTNIYFSQITGFFKIYLNNECHVF
ncbi:hypothetical protein, partial [Glutamicibacter ardleyensis]|uniref:hypothetical protein n=1 Tax=Glutamicibacter ardleyensis TaxID=225894 RepID=UPI003FD150FC